MSNGIIASMLLLAQGGGGPVGNQTLFLDFVNEEYEVNGTPTAIGDIIDAPGQVSPGDGLEIPLFGTPIEILNDALDTLLTANWTMVLEFEITTLSNTVYLFSMMGLGSAALDFDDDNRVQIGVESATDRIYATDFLSDTPARNIDYGVVTVAVHKLAIARSDERIVMSVNGQAVQDDSETEIPMVFLTNATFGNYSDDVNAREAFIRSLTLYDEINEDSVLQTLSEL